MKNILLVTMDNELNSYEDAPNVIKMLNSLKNTKVLRVIFYITSTSTILIRNIESYYKNNLKNEFKLNIVKIKESTNINECLSKIERTIFLNSRNNAKLNVMLNYTYGTKSMAMALSICSMVFTGVLTKNLKEYDLGSSITNTATQERFKTINDNIIIKLVQQHFNDYRYRSALAWLNSDKDVCMYEDYETLIHVYSNGDKFNHIEFPKGFNPNRFDKDVFEQILKNKKAFKILTDNKHPLYKYYILADLINNAKRRVREDKYDDAIARLYRALDLIKTIRLKEYGINLNNISKTKLNEFNIKNLNESNAMSIYMGYKILSKLDDEVGKYFIENLYIFNDIIASRNNSILAHGLSSKTKGEFEMFLNYIIPLSRRLCPQITTLLSILEYPSFEINEYV